MKFLRTAKVKIDALKLPGDWQRRLADPDVQELSDSFDTVPLLQRPGIRKDREIIWGRDRLAACYLRAQRTVEVDIWEATDDEVRLAELTENARRRNGNRDKDVAALVALLVRQRQEEAEDVLEHKWLSGNPHSTACGKDGNKQGDWQHVTCPECLALGREWKSLPADPQPDNPLSDSPEDRNKPLRSEASKADKAAARKKAAELLGTTPAAVKQAEHRAAAKDPEPGAADVETNAPAAPGEGVTAALAEINRLLVEAQKKLTKLTQEEPTLGERFGVQGAKSQISEAAGFLRGIAPGGECLYCKRIPSEQPNCQPCAGSGWLTKAQIGNVPKELRATGDEAAIYVRGELVLVSSLTGAAPAPKPASKPARGARRIRTIMADAEGNEVEVQLPPVED